MQRKKNLPFCLTEEPKTKKLVSVASVQIIKGSLQNVDDLTLSTLRISNNLSKYMSLRPDTNLL